MWSSKTNKPFQFLDQLDSVNLEPSILDWIVALSSSHSLQKKLITKRVYYGQVRKLLSKEMASPLHGHCLKSEQSIKQSIVGFGRPKQDANNAHDSSTSWNSVVTCTHWHMYAGTYIISTLSAVRPKVYLHVPAVALKTNFGVRNSEFTRITFA